MKIFDPSSTQSRRRARARVTSDAGSEPLPGSVSAVTAERLAAAHPRQPLRLLLLRPPLRDRLAGEAVVDRDDPAHRRVGAAELLHHDAVRHGVEPHAAVLLRQRAAEEADLGELRDDPAIHPLRAVPLARVRHDLAVAERAGRLPDQLLLLGERRSPRTRILPHMPNLAGKVAIVTGAGRGIGRAHALALARGRRAASSSTTSAPRSPARATTTRPRSRSSRRSRPPAARRPRTRENVADFDGAERMVQQAIDDVRPARHPRQQRRDPARPDAREHDRAGVGRRDRRSPQGPLRADAARGRVLARALEGRRRGQGPRDQHVEPVGRLRQHRPVELRRGEGRHRRLHAHRRAGARTATASRSTASRRTRARA